MNKKLLLVPIFLLISIIYFYQTQQKQTTQKLSGYVLADTIYMSASTSGELQSLNVERGQEVSSGQKLFSLDISSNTARIKQVEANIRQFQARIELEKALLARSKESLAIALAEAERTEEDFKRYKNILAKNRGAVSQIDVDHARIAAKSAQIEVNAAAKDIDAALANITIAESQKDNAIAEKDILLRNKTELSPLAPVNGRIEDIFIQKGEWSSANQAVLSIVPNDKVKLRFYVPEKELHKYSIGTRLELSWTGAKKEQFATVDYIAPKPEFTPPVIYSLNTNEKLVFCIEAKPDEIKGLSSGQPIAISLKKE